MRRLISRICIGTLAMGAAAVLAFGPRPVSQLPPGRVRIQYWEKWTGLEAQQAQKIVDAFNNTVGREKNIWVDFNSMSQIDRKTIISTAAGAPPDVVGVWDGQVQEYASLGALEPLESYFAAHGMRRDSYKPVYLDGCSVDGKLYAVPSTVWCVAMIWNKQVFADHADALRAAGCDPTRAPETIAELDRYAAAIDTYQTVGGRRRISTAGFIPAEPGSFTHLYGIWFGADIVDPTGRMLHILSPAMEKTFDWYRGYSERLGRDELADFRSGFSNGTTSMSDTPQNPFLLGWIAMQQQGPWIAALIEKLRPEGMRWHVPADQLQREKDFTRITPGMAADQVESILGSGQRAGDSERWPAGIKQITIVFENGKVATAEARLLPAKERQQYCQWGMSAFPSGVPGKTNITYAGMDVWGIPSTSKHKDEAFEFIAFASRQEQIENLASMHCNLSPLVHQSQQYLQNHPNPYVEVYEMLSASPNARPLPKVLNWPFVTDELLQAAERSGLLLSDTHSILAAAQARAQSDLDAVLPDSKKGGVQ